jgi:hypothetical protein
MFPYLKDRLVGAVATVLFYVPLVRELFLLSGYRDARRSVLEAALRAGESVYLLAGGEAESLLSEPGTDRMVVGGDGRLGLFRLALETRSPVVPMYTFHK